MRAIGTEEGWTLLRSRADLLHDGCTERDVARLLEGGGLVRVRRGWYADAEAWKQLWPEGCHLLLVLATHAESSGGEHPYSYQSAAAVHAFPLYRAPMTRVHVTARPGIKISSTRDVLRHQEQLSEADVVVIDGLRCTSSERTAFDLMRSLSLEAAVAVADASLGRAAVRDRAQDEAAATAWRERTRARAMTAGAVRGVRQARWVIEFADGRSELPAESVSRLQLHRLGFARPRVQVPIDRGDGRAYWVDLGLDDVPAWGEIDGEAKYRDAAMRGGRSVEDVVLAEKQREDWIRGATGRRVIRWGMREASDPLLLSQRLAAFGVHPLR